MPDHVDRSWEMSTAGLVLITYAFDVYIMFHISSVQWALATMVLVQNEQGVPREQKDNLVWVICLKWNEYH